MVLPIDYTSDFHMHTTWSDGSAGVREVIAAAARKGMERIALTDHMPLPYKDRYEMDADNIDRYREEILGVRGEYAGKMEVRLGMEMEYLPGHEAWTERIVEKGWEHTIASVHAIVANGHRSIVNGTLSEFNSLLESSFGGSIRRLCTHYYRHLQRMIHSGLFTVVGHLDVLKKHNRDGAFFSEEAQWYRELVLETLEHAAASGMKVEINTGGFNHPAGACYPSLWIIRACMERELPLILSSDAHAPSRIGGNFQKVKQLLEE